jgi:hypothetical protein
VRDLVNGGKECKKESVADEKGSVEEKKENGGGGGEEQQKKGPKRYRSVLSCPSLVQQVFVLTQKK